MCKFGLSKFSLLQQLMMKHLKTPYVTDFKRDFINKTYDWDAAMQRASGEDSTFSEVGVKIKILYIYISYVLHLLLIYAYIDLMHKS